eukprot:CAMPEP_0117447844 /NCGR_PEP_ID=MMETSP0759-20121206/7087_1 /TAXON_ID=63605 /ORGANISM="Percolomonas cosmopolitus, Strain WS" /LENGTH=617 /DNA_ID=CAMNT_0005240197 /DNA_START=481 /DNA_END=2335 /DNA_ORIENTATION=-
MEHIRERLSKQSLTQIFLPGTHEASAYNLTNVASPDEDPTIRNYAKKYGMLYSWVVKPWSTNQALDTYGQLMRGARFLDWRISYRAGDDGFDEGPIDAFFSAHGLWASNLEVMLEELIHFLNETSYEIVMMELSHFYEINEERYARMQQLIADTVGPYLITYNDFPLRTADDFFERVTYQDIINLSDKRKRVLLFLDPLELNSTIVYPQPQYGFFNISSLEIPWADTSKTQKMMDFEGQHLSASSGRWNQLYGVQFLLTEQEFDIIEGIIGTVLPGFNLDSIEKLSRFANSRMDEFFEKWLSNRKVSNMIVDRIENTPVVDHAIRINAQACNDNPVYRDPTTVGNCQELKKKGRCDSPDDFMRQNCALTCQLCPKIHGLPGDECVSDSDCESSLGIGAGSRCKTSTSRCLIPDPYPVDHSCGADYQCETGFCNMQTSLCSGRFLGDKCEKNVDCLYGTCQQEICNGTVSHHIVGVTPICRTFEEDCLRNGLLYITKTIGDMEGICKSVLGVIHGNKMICTNARLPVKKSTGWGVEANSMIVLNSILIQSFPTDAASTTVVTKVRLEFYVGQTSRDSRGSTCKRTVFSVQLKTSSTLGILLLFEIVEQVNSSELLGGL